MRMQAELLLKSLFWVSSEGFKLNALPEIQKHPQNHRSVPCGIFRENWITPNTFWKLPWSEDPPTWFNPKNRPFHIWWQSTLLSGDKYRNSFYEQKKTMMTSSIESFAFTNQKTTKQKMRRKKVQHFVCNSVIITFIELMLLAKP